MIQPRLLPLGLFLLCFAGPGAAWGEDLAPERVGRMTALEGGASLRPAGAEWSDAAINDPVAAGMAVRTASQARVKLRVGPDTIGLSAGTQIEIGRLDPNTMQIALPRGRVGVHLVQIDPASAVEIDIPRGAVYLLVPGDYDVSAGDEKTPARVRVLEGGARTVAEGIDETIPAGSAFSLNGGKPALAKLDRDAGDDVAWWRSPADRPDDNREASQALRFVSAEMTGYEALDGNGRWDVSERYGAVWFPATLPEGWAPYRYGHWRWLPPWGWTWVDDASWGFATSHYGRWVRIDDGWAWVPGTRTEHPAYAPALVAFLGTAGVGLSYPDGNGPAVAWFPLAPGEVYWPSYTGDLDTIRHINAGAVADTAAIDGGANGGPPAAIVRGDYRNRRFATVVPRPVFAAGRAVPPALIELPGRRLDNAPLLAGSPQIPPAASRTEQVVRAVRALARILVPRAPAPVAQAVAVVRGGRHAARAVAAAVSKQSRNIAHAARERLAAAVAPRSARSRVIHLAAAHRRSFH